MEDNDEWKLGDEGERPPCPRCGKVNRPGLTHCAICGTALADERESGSEVLRTIGESMGRRRPARGQRPGGGSPRAWIVAAGLLLLIVAVLTWLQSGERPFRLEDLRGTVAPTALPPPPTAIATRVAATATPRPAPTSAPIVAPAPAPTAVPTVAPPPTAAPTPAPTVPPPPAPTARPTATARAKRAAAPPRPTRHQPAPTAVASAEPVAEATPALRPAVEATEKPSLGSDLQEATRDYRRAVDVHNQRVDEYNALADEIQRRRAFDDSPESVELRRRLDRAREAVESARANAEALRTRMEAVRSRYR